MANKNKAEGDKENVYEQKIKEADQRSSKLFKKEKDRIQNNLMTGMFFSIPLILLMLYIYKRGQELDKVYIEKNKEELRRTKLKQGAPKIKMKQLYP